VSIYPVLVGFDDAFIRVKVKIQVSRTMLWGSTGNPKDDKRYSKGHWEAYPASAALARMSHRPKDSEGTNAANV
jgi:hypothetical protein